MIQWERGAKNGAYELIEQQDKLKAENAALKQENEGLKHGNDGWFNSWNVCDEDRKKLKQSLAAAEKREKKLLAIIDDYKKKLIRVEGSDTISEAEGRERELKEKVREWLATNLIIYCAECGLEIEDIDWDELDMLLGGEK